MKKVVVWGFSFLLLCAGCGSESASGGASNSTTPEAAEKVDELLVTQRAENHFEILKSVGECAMRVSRATTTYTVEVLTINCDPLSTDLAPYVERSLARLHALQPNDPEIQVSIYMPGQRTLVTKWAEVLKNSPVWEKQPKKRPPGSTKEYPLLRKLMLQSNLFEPYSKMLAPLNYQFKDVQIEKVAYMPANHFTYFEEDLAPLKYTPAEKIPLPLMTTILFKQSAPTSAPAPANKPNL